MTFVEILVVVAQDKRNRHKSKIAAINAFLFMISSSWKASKLFGVCSFSVTIEQPPMVCQQKPAPSHKKKGSFFPPFLMADLPIPRSHWELLLKTGHIVCLTLAR